MIKPFHVLGYATRIWWREWIGMFFLNLLWVLLLIPIVTAPPATAAFYAIGKRVYDGELWGIREIWQHMRELFWPAWRWALPNLLLLLVLLGNFYIYQDVSGTAWVVLRFIWAFLLILWMMFNLYYWPFWLAQEDKSMRTTYANCGRFLLLNPWPTLIITLICSLMLIVSVLTIIPLLIGAIAWLVLVGVTAVNRSLELHGESRS
jgi:uncharacterized membrane protein YesL